MPTTAAPTATARFYEDPAEPHRRDWPDGCRFVFNPQAGHEFTVIRRGIDPATVAACAGVEKLEVRLHHTSLLVAAVGFRAGPLPWAWAVFDGRDPSSRPPLPATDARLMPDADLRLTLVEGKTGEILVGRRFRLDRRFTYRLNEAATLMLVANYHPAWHTQITDGLRSGFAEPERLAQEAAVKGEALAIG